MYKLFAKYVEVNMYLVGDLKNCILLNSTFLFFSYIFLCEVAVLLENQYSYPYSTVLNNLNMVTENFAKILILFSRMF